MTAAMLLATPARRTRFLQLAAKAFSARSWCPVSSQAKALSRRNDDPEHACRPFDLDRDGFVIGEGGGALLIETEEHALARGATIHAVLAGWANTSDAHHVTAPCPDGEGAARCMKLRAAARRNAAVRHRLYQCARHLDAARRQGGNAGGQGRVRRPRMRAADVLDQVRDRPPHGRGRPDRGHRVHHGQSAEGVTSADACTSAQPDPDCDLDYVPNTARKADISAAMSNSLGFGGQNSSLIVAKYEK